MFWNRNWKNTFNFLLLALPLGAAQAQANCWNECAVPNPFSGGCSVKVKVCDVENPRRALADFEAGVRGGMDALRAEWQRLWGQVPAPLRSVLERYPISIMSTVMPETRAYTVVLAAIESYYHRAKDRAGELDHVIKDQPEWKQRYGYYGYVALLGDEAIALSTHDFNALSYDPVGEKYDGIWNNFLSCLGSASDEPAASQCHQTLKREKVRIDYGV